MIIQTHKGAGNLPKYHAECKSCGSKYEALQPDLDFTFSRNEIVVRTMECTECGGHGLLFEKEVGL